MRMLLQEIRTCGCRTSWTRWLHPANPEPTEVPERTMQMSVRSRILDLLPVVLVFALVAAFGTFVLVEYVAREPLRVPPPQAASTSELVMPPSIPASSRHAR
jgi:hypothetical protein